MHMSGCSRWVAMGWSLLLPSMVEWVMGTGKASYWYHIRSQLGASVSSCLWNVWLGALGCGGPLGRFWLH